MSAIRTIKQLFGIDDATSQSTQYRCRDCGTEFQSAKSPDRTMCVDCLSRDVERVD